MKNLSDEILNRYIDNELSTEELENLNEIINNNPDELIKLKTHSLVDRILKKLTLYTAPANTTSEIMEKIYSINPAINIKGKIFFLSVLSLFASIILGVFVYGIVTLPTQSTEIGPSSFIQKINNFFQNFNLQNIFNNKTTLIIISVLIILVLLMGYFLKDAHKSFLRRLENITPKNPLKA